MTLIGQIVRVEIRLRNLSIRHSRTRRRARDTMVLARFLPQDERFFEYFQRVASNAAEVAQELYNLLDDYTEVERKTRRVSDLEHLGDEITHQIYDALNRTFVTPLDREDITDLAGRIDDFVDAIEHAARRIWLYRIDEPTEYACTLARIINEQGKLIATTVPHLEHRQQWKHMLQCTIDIQRLENEADDVLDQAVMNQFNDTTDIASLITGHGPTALALRPGASPPGDGHFRPLANLLGGLDGLQPRWQRRSEDDGGDHDGPGQLLWLDGGPVAGAAMGNPGCRDLDGSGHGYRRLAYHPHGGAEGRRSTAYQWLRGRNRLCRSNRDCQSSRHSRFDDACCPTQNTVTCSGFRPLW